MLEERVNDKKEQLLEKDLVLEEVSNLANRLRTQALEGREDTLELAKRVNDFQARIKGTTRRMMATVSELSMYQATCLKLEGDQGELEALLQEARERLAQGLAPTAEAEREWFRLIRQADTVARMRIAREEADRMGEAETKGLKTTAELRPNAYVSAALGPMEPGAPGQPRPYPVQGPFKPSAQGATMRHIRKPTIQEIVL